eukprot:m.474130 g.474130  ORF g.474130 m.474130 type:complete len:969 (-) comp21671_c0_seq2:3026-5932(-)
MIGMPKSISGCTLFFQKPYVHRYVRTVLCALLLLGLQCQAGNSYCLYTPNATGHVDIPSTDTFVGELSFFNCTSIITVSIPNSITAIDFVAFGDSSLTAIEIPDSVVSIGSGAFSRCVLLSTVHFSPSLTTLGNGAFSQCISLQTISLPDSVRTIPGDCFMQCAALRTVHIPDSVTLIGVAAFLSCNALTVISIPDSVLVLEQFSFVSQSITSVSIPQSVTFVGGGSFTACVGFGLATKASSLSDRGNLSHYFPIPRGIMPCTPCYNETSLPAVSNAAVSIGFNSFMSCTFIQDVSKLPDSILSIQENAFAFCTDLRTVTIPPFVTVLDRFAFLGCTSLASIVIPDMVGVIGIGAFQGCTSLAGLALSNTVTSIGDDAFSTCVSLTSVNIPSSIAPTISSTVFYGCTFCSNNQTLISAQPQELQATVGTVSGTYSALVMSDVTYVASYAFYHCRNVNMVNLTDSVQVIQRLAMSLCSSLNNVHIPDSVTSIEFAAFQGCTGLDTIRIPPTVNISDGAFFGCGCPQALYTNGSALNKCVRGFIEPSTDTWAEYAQCDFQNEYQTSSGSYTSDVACTRLTVCDAATQLEMAPATPTTDRHCGSRPRGLATWQIAGIVTAVTVLFGALLGSRVYQKHKKQRLAQDLDLHQRLLHDERTEKQTLYAENVEMKRAWEIAEVDLSMERELASGAFGAVWQAKWGHVPVAVKMLKHPVDDEFDPLAGEDFNREVSFMQQTRHPNLLIFYGAGVTSRHIPFLVVELMVEGSMRKVLLSNRVLSTDTLLSMATDIARGMRHLHSLGSMHRDLKSDNCLVGADLHVKIGDFGASRLLAASARGSTATTTSDHLYDYATPSATLTRGVGTMLWMAPELFAVGSPYGSKIDVYSYGIVMWELLTRATPWEVDLPVDGIQFFLALADAVQGGTRPTVPADKTDVFPPPYIVLMQQCWAHAPDERPTFSEVVKTLETEVGAI